MTHPRELLNTIVWSADAKHPRSVKTVKVPAYLIEVARDLLRGPTAEGKRYLKRLMQAEYYGPNKATGTKWRIERRRLMRDDLVLLCSSGEDYVVFTFWLPRIGPKMCPTDTFTSGLANGEALFDECVTELMREPKLALSKARR